MAKLRVHSLTMSLDGYVAGPEQGLEYPLGIGGEELHEWMFATRNWREMVGEEGGEEGVDHEWAQRGFEGIGATIMGRNMFAPMRGPWVDDEWKGWWGDNPPYHSPVFVLTHYARGPIPMEGGTTFHFVTDGIEKALDLAFKAAGGKDVRLGGGASVVRQYLRAGLVDEMHFVVAPRLLGGGERLFEDVSAGVAGMEVADFVATPAALHVRLVKKA